MPDTSPRIDLLAPLQLIHRLLTRSLAEEAWASERVTERRRTWCLWEMAVFWVSVVMQSPRSLRAALQERVGELPGWFSPPKSARSAFFTRSQNLPWRFFAAVFTRFRAAAMAVAPRSYGGALRGVARRFRGVQIVDGSRLDAVSHRLKILWHDRRAVLAGSVLAFYDLATGTVSQLVFDPDAAASEFKGAVDALKSVARGTLLVGDRLYGVPGFFRALADRGIFALARRFGVVKVTNVRRLSRRRLDAGVVEDWVVVAGAQGGAPRMRLRLIRLIVGGAATLELFTNVLDPRRLSAEESLALYRGRWTVERLFSELKEVLNLKRFYGANVNSVGMQVYAAAIVHTAMRMAKALAARQAGVRPEEISSAKFNPKAASASVGLVIAEIVIAATTRANRGLKLRRPRLAGLSFASATLDQVRVEPRRSSVRRRARPRRRSKWRSLPPPRQKRPKREKLSGRR